MAHGIVHSRRQPFVFFPLAPLLHPCPHKQAMASSCDAETPGAGVPAAVPVVLPKLLCQGAAGGDAAFMKSLEESVLVMESLAESILVMKKQREQLKREKENLTRMLKNARQRYTRLKKKAHPLACDDLVDELITGSDACDMSVDCEPTAAPAAVGKRGDDLLMSF